MSKTVADRLIARLRTWGVDTVFGLPGDGVNGLFEALRKQEEKIRFIQVRHEESAAFAACGYAKFSGRLGVCIATSGPGGIHLLNGLYDAKFDGQPVLAITGHTFHDLIGTHYQQDVDLDKLFIDVAAYNERIMGAAHVDNIVDQAVKTALARRTVVHINIPKDVQDWADSNGDRSAGNVADHSSNIFAASHPTPDESMIDKAIDLINRGSRIAILAGRGCLGARTELLELAEKLAAPIIKPLLGKAVVPDDSLYTTGGIGLLGTAASQEALSDCDTLIIAGSSFPYLEFYPRPGKAKTIQIDLDPARVGLRHEVDVGLIGDCRGVLRSLVDRVPRKDDRSFLKQAQENMQEWNKLLNERASRTDMPMKPQTALHKLNELLDEDAIVCCDTGTVTTWAARHIQIRGEMQFSASGTLASMANALPYSIGAAVANPGRQIICIAGDGGFSMLMAELATLVKYALPVKIMIIKNNSLGMIKWEQLVLEGNPQYGVELQPIDFELIAEACGAAGWTLEDPADADRVLREMIAHDGPALVQAVVDPHEPPMPGKLTTEQAIHFTEALLKGQRDRWKIIKTVAEDKIREVI